MSSNHSWITQSLAHSVTSTEPEPAEDYGCGCELGGGRWGLADSSADLSNAPQLFPPFAPYAETRKVGGRRVGAIPPPPPAARRKSSAGKRSSDGKSPAKKQKKAAKPEPELSGSDGEGDAKSSRGSKSRTYLVFDAKMRPVFRTYSKDNRKGDSQQSQVTGRIPSRAALKAVFAVIDPHTATFSNVDGRRVTKEARFFLVETGKRKDGTEVNLNPQPFVGRIEDVPEDRMTPFMKKTGLAHQAYGVRKVKSTTKH